MKAGTKESEKEKKRIKKKKIKRNILSYDGRIEKKLLKENKIKTRKKWTKECKKDGRKEE